MEISVLLIVPPLPNQWIKSETEKYEHLGCGYLLASLPKSISAGIIDAYNYALSYDDILAKIEEYHPKIIGISCNFYNLLSSAVCLASKIKAKFPRVHVTLGGHGVIHDKDRLLETNFVDSLCLCEGEFCFPQFVTAYLNGERYWDTDGMWFKYDGEIHKNQQLPLVTHLDDLPFPIRTNIITSHTLPEDFSSGIFTVITSRGCPYNCTFCDIKAFYANSTGSPWRMRSAKNIVDEIELLYKKYNARYFLFGDDNFIGSTPAGVSRAEDICNLLLDRKIDIKFGIEARVSDMKPERMKRLKRAGLVSVMLGVENADQKTLDRWNKRISPQDSAAAIKLLAELGIDCHVNYILYDAFTTLDDLMTSYNFFKDTGIFRYEDPIYLFENRLGVFPGTQTYDQLKQTSRLIVKPEIVSGTSYTIYNYDYEIENPEVRRFAEYNNYWLRRVRKFKGTLSAQCLEKFRKTSGVLYLKAFKMSIDLARTVRPFDASELDMLLEIFENKICQLHK